MTTYLARLKARSGKKYPTDELPKLSKPSPGGNEVGFDSFGSAHTGHFSRTTVATVAPRNFSDAGEYSAAEWTDAHEKRAAVIEYGGGTSRNWSEAFARLDRARPPDDVPERRWRRFIDDCGRFLDDGWATKAAALGWGPLDLFGCDRHRPFARIDQLGLLWLLNGRRVVALTADTGIIETPDGGRLVYRRAPSGPGQVLVWELNSTEGKRNGC
jgi:hypothetical protein